MNLDNLEKISILQMTNLIRNTLIEKANLRVAEELEGDTLRIKYSISLIKKEFNWEPKIMFIE